MGRSKIRLFLGQNKVFWIQVKFIFFAINTKYDNIDQSHGAFKIDKATTSKMGVVFWHIEVYVSLF
jgi:hypothetical protein